MNLETIKRPTPKSLHTMLSERADCKTAAKLIKREITNYDLLPKKHEPLRIYWIRENG